MDAVTRAMAKKGLPLQLTKCQFHVPKLYGEIDLPEDLSDIAANIQCAVRAHGARHGRMRREGGPFGVQRQ